ncbi:hypothetical protein [Limnoglobus roseus]|uniref:Uncharacterized protein n=1 Tax=Limnoglobus roseus TaxID=2598579 RepID=A0A5C1AM74_9BACT|nr:hypothetical protein [Limnoglobus roseus]QEL19066.1 hypothetical protein PX52LOC_06123 [Limnoglobus roseus]
MRTLLYKRTHSGDPDTDGRFGCHNCMGTVREREFNAVIGVGGEGKGVDSDVAGNLNWIGIGPRKHIDQETGYLIVTFDVFRDFNRLGIKFRAISPLLAARMYEGGARTLMTFSREEQAEIDDLLARVEIEPRTGAVAKGGRPRPKTCRPKRRRNPLGSCGR